MNTGAAVLIAVGALAVVFYVNKQSEAATARQAQMIRNAKNSQGLTGGDAVRIIGTAGATFAGGPAAGAAFASRTGGLS